ncbi:arsenic resistance protein [Nocardioides nanhaiensis]|uniref:arsenic resistance protein n=1 Tax=Nocardioides nanhaiensis TaxID=1476871 RepID=UPI0031EC724B
MASPAVAWLERHQVALYVLAIAAGLAIGVGVPGAHRLEVAITPVLAALLHATFLAVPFHRLGSALRDLRFLTALLVLNLAVVPLVVLALSRVVAGEPALLVGVLLVLLAPCIDYVIVFAGLAGGAAERLLAAAPLLMLLQLVLLPPALVLLLGPQLSEVVSTGALAGPLVEALVLLVLAPLALAVLVQVLSAREGSAARASRRWEGWSGAAMVPLMVATLAVVVASQAGAVDDRLPELLPVVPIYAGFLVVMAPLGLLVARLARLDVGAGRALVFSGATRNSLVVLPIALALPAELALVPLVVVTQTLVELVGMLVYLRVVPRLLPHPRR